MGSLPTSSVFGGDRLLTPSEDNQAFTGMRITTTTSSNALFFLELSSSEENTVCCWAKVNSGDGGSQHPAARALDLWGSVAVCGYAVGRAVRHMRWRSLIRTTLGYGGLIASAPVGLFFVNKRVRVRNLKRKVLSAGGNILCLLLSVKRCLCGEV